MNKWPVSETETEKLVNIVKTKQQQKKSHNVQCSGEDFQKDLSIPPEFLVKM